MALISCIEMVALFLLSVLHPSDRYQLRFQPPKESRYAIHRVWRSNPPQSGNGSQTHNFDIVVSPGDRQLRLGFTSFSGHDDKPADRGIAKGLANLKKNIKGLRLVRGSSSDGVGGPWQFDRGNNTGWAGMMSAKACGMYEVGPFELHYPKDPVGVGSAWKAQVHLGDEGLDSDQMNWVKGNDPLCTYRLDAVDAKSNTAKISFHVETKVTGNLNDIFTKKPVTISQTEKLSGSWTIDLRTGMPLRFSSSRIVKVPAVASYRGTTERTETLLTRL